jgi:hypothetical protein
VEHQGELTSTLADAAEMPGVQILDQFLGSAGLDLAEMLTSREW